MKLNTPLVTVNIDKVGLKKSTSCNFQNSCEQIFVGAIVSEQILVQRGQCKKKMFISNYLL